MNTPQLASKARASRPAQLPSTTQPAIGYLRVSTKEQGRSGLGLGAQRLAIETFGAREGFSIKSWYQDVQTGAGADALLLRPGLATALKEARAAHCPLMVAKLDRLSRNVHFITGLMEHKVHFIVTALGRDCDEFTLHIYASLAEQERKMIGERVKAAHAVARRKGWKVGLQCLSTLERRRIWALSNAARRKGAMERAEAYRPHIEWALRQAGLNGRPISFEAAARALNARNIESMAGRRWSGIQLQLVARRLGMNHPKAVMRIDEARLRVRAIWKQHPGFTAMQVVRSLDPRFRRYLGIRRISLLLLEFRLASAKRSEVHRKVGWRINKRTKPGGVGWWIDEFTADRIRIAEICKRYPDYNATQVLKALQMARPLKQKRLSRRRWVSSVMNQCWEALGSRGPRYVKGYTPARRKRCAEAMRKWRLSQLRRSGAARGKTRARQRTAREARFHG